MVTVLGTAATCQVLVGLWFGSVVMMMWLSIGHGHGRGGCAGARARPGGKLATHKLVALKSYSHIQVTVATRQCALVGKKQRRGPSADDCNLSGRTDCAAGPEGDELGEDRVTSLVVMNKACGMKGARWRAGFFLIVRVCSWACKRRKN